MNTVTTDEGLGVVYHVIPDIDNLLQREYEKGRLDALQEDGVITRGELKSIVGKGYATIKRLEKEGLLPPPNVFDGWPRRLIRDLIELSEHTYKKKYGI